MGQAATQPDSGMTRRSFLTKAAIVAAAGVGASLLLRKKVFGKQADPGVHVDEDSLFLPRADQRDRVLGRK